MSEDWAKYQGFGEKTLESGDYAYAETIILGALREAQVFETSDPRLARTLESLAEACSRQNKNAEAEVFYMRALGVRELYAGANHMQVGCILNNLSKLYFRQGDYAKAEPVCERVKEIYQLNLGKDHPNTAAVTSNLAIIYHCVGKLAEAEPHYREALDTKISSAGSDNTEVIKIVKCYANLLDQLGRSDEAKQMRETFIRPAVPSPA